MVSKKSVRSGGARRMMVRTVVAATLVLAPAAVLVPVASGLPCKASTDVGCNNPDGTLDTGPHHRPGGFDDHDETDRYGIDGYDVFGYDKFGYNRFGYDRFGYDRQGYDREGYTAQGCARVGADRPNADAAACERRRSRPATGSAS
ncbi:hypothetical protein [Nocardia sp. NPDC052316]|uniref:hypothetical protein n=1 Tax=Nocardia sp. NPDC052316 TaxID=3364329 RepID=UPI0037C837A0